MQILIEISDETYKKIQNKILYPWDVESILNGISTPKGHGRLIDADALCEELGDINMDIYTNEVKEMIDNAPTVIEADKDNQFIEMLKLTIDECLKNELREYKG